MVKLFNLQQSKLELQTYGPLHTRNFLYHVLATVNFKNDGKTLF